MSEQQTRIQIHADSKKLIEDGDHAIPVYEAIIERLTETVTKLRACRVIDTQILQTNNILELNNLLYEKQKILTTNLS